MKIIWFLMIATGLSEGAKIFPATNSPENPICLNLTKIIFPCTCEETYSDGSGIYLFCDGINNDHLEFMMSNILHPIITLSISNSNVSVLNDNIFKSLKLKSLSISGSGLNQIERDAFVNLEDSLEEIYLVNNSLSEMSVAFSVLQKLQTLNLRQNQINTFPSNVLEKMTALTLIDLSNNEIETVPTTFQLNKLISLYLDDNMIHTITDGAFKEFPNLLTLSLNRNNLTELSPNIFQGLKMLQELSLSSNMITFLSNTVFNNLLFLDSLDLSNNMLERLKPLTFEKLKITNLNLKNNQLMEITKDIFNNLQSLQKLDLSQNLIEKINKESFVNLVKLNQLFLSNNKLKYIEEMSFINLPKLQELYLDNNMLQNLTSMFLSDLQKLNNLKLLNLTQNFLEDLPMFPPNLKIEALCLANNKISKVAKGIFENLKNLLGIFLQGNEISNLEEAFKNMENIKSIYLSQNKLKTIESNFFKNLTSLLSLSLDQNNILYFEEGVFNDLKSLFYLSLHKNKIKSIRNIFEGETLKEDYNSTESLNSLIQADFSENMLTSITKRDMKPLKSLKFVYLMNNYIEMIEPGSFDDMRSLYVVNLKGNNLQRVSSNIFNALSSINILDLTNCSIAQIEENAFTNLINLTSLFLGSNNLSMLPNTLFSQTFLSKSQSIDLDVSFNHFEYIPFIVLKTPIRRLLMSNNNLSNISFTTFQFPEFLKEVSFRNNSIKEINNSTFHQLFHPQLIDLSFNKIVKIGKQTFDNKWTSLVILEGNPLMCDCSLKWMLTWFLQRSIDMRLSLQEFIKTIFKDVNYLTCQGPSNLKQVSLFLISPKELECSDTHLQEIQDS